MLLCALAGCGFPDARVQTSTVALGGDSIELAVAERLPEQGGRAFLIHAITKAAPEEQGPLDWGASRRAAMDAEAAQRCPGGWARSGQTDIFTESLDWIHCAP